MTMKTNWQFKHKAITTEAKAEVQLISTIITFWLAALRQSLQYTSIGQLTPWLPPPPPKKKFKKVLITQNTG